MKFLRTDLLDMLWGSSDKLKLIKDDICDHSRWSVIHDLIFQDLKSSLFYKTDYSVGATESQDEAPWQWADDEIECQEVEPKERVITTYVAVATKEAKL